MKPKIISLGYALPRYAYSEEEIFNALGYPKHFWRIFRDSGIVKRHFCIPLWVIKSLNFQRQQDEYLRSAVSLSTQAVKNCLDGRTVEDIGCVVFASCTGFSPGPTIPHYLLDEFGFKPNTIVTNLSSHGCEGGFSGIRRAHDFVVATGRPALSINCELCSLTYFPEGEKPDDENDYELMRGNAIFADAAASALIGFDEDPRHPEILDFETYTNTKYMNELGFTWRDGRLRLLLSKRVPDYAGEIASVAVTELLRRWGLLPTQVKYWVIHAAGMRVIELIGKTLGLSEEALYASKSTLKYVGNVSSATVGVTGKLLMEFIKPKPNDMLVMVNVGPGMTSNAMICRFAGGEK